MKFETASIVSLYIVVFLSDEGPSLETLDLCSFRILAVQQHFILQFTVLKIASNVFGKVAQFNLVCHSRLDIV